MAAQLSTNLVELAEEIVNSRRGVEMILENCSTWGEVYIDWTPASGFAVDLEIKADGGYIPATYWEPAEAIAVDVASETFEARKIADVANWLGQWGYSL
jgi:hypothetical protein